MCCSVLHCVAVCYSAMQSAVVCSSMLRTSAMLRDRAVLFFFVKRKKRRPVRWFVAEGRVLLLIARVLVVAIPVCANL